MGALSRKLDRFCYKHPNIAIPNLMKIIAMGTVFVFILNEFSDGQFSLMIGFIPEMIYKGQIWRLITFIFVPSTNNIFFFLITTMFYYWIGNSLEQKWGSTRFTVFYALGILLNVILGLVGGFWVNMYYINMSMFFAFATLYPDMQVLVYFIIPVKIKWMAYLNVALFAFDMTQYLGAGQWFPALMPVFAVFNYLIFFWDDLTSSAKSTKQRNAYKNSAQSINFKKAQKDVQQRKGYLHKCTICGVTDADKPDMDFRYCSKCHGYHCYCSDHINQHVHIE